MPTEQTTLSRIIGAIGEGDFAAVAADAVSDFMAFELVAIVLHRPAAGAAVMFDNFDRAGGRQGLATYVALTHRLNPILAARGGRGAFRARDFAIRPRGALARDHLVRAADEELGFRTVGWPERLEEVGLYFEACGGVVELGCYRARGGKPTDRIDALNGLCEPIAAAFERHSRLGGTPAMEGLSAREREVADLLLAGCGSEAIGLRLGISRHTVKDHRKQIFRKLRVGSLAELFALGRRGAVLN